MFGRARHRPAKPTRTVRTEFQAEVEQTSSGGQIVLVVQGLNVSGFGPTIDAAWEDLIAAMDSFLHSLCHHGDVEEVFNASGINYHVREVVVPQQEPRCHTVAGIDSRVEGWADRSDAQLVFA